MATRFFVIVAWSSNVAATTVLYWSVNVVRSDDGDLYNDEDKISSWNFALSILFIFLD